MTAGSAGNPPASSGPPRAASPRPATPIDDPAMNDERYTLTLIRHAKSSWKQPLPDIERPLNHRGRRNAIELGQWLKDRHVRFDRIVSSPARRTLDTAASIAAQMGLPETIVESDGDVYLASAAALLALIHRFDDAEHHVALVGHNPGISDLAARLLPFHLDDELRTCACLQLAFEHPSWRQIVPGSGQPVFFHDPKGRHIGKD